MSFWGSRFVFDGIPSESFDLMIYDIGNNTQGRTEFSNVVSIKETSVGNRWRPLFFGTTFEKKTEIEMVFGITQERIDSQQFLDRQEMSYISSWLAGKEDYSWLEIQQDDMENIRYRCIVTSLEAISYGNIPVAFKARFTCDSPFAYLYPHEYTFSIDGEADVEVFNESTHNGFYYPDLEIDMTSGEHFSITNESDDGRLFAFSGLPVISGSIHVNNDTGVIMTESGENLYPYFNFQFLRLKRGANKLHITGSGTLKIKCEFPVSAGG